MIIPKRFKYFLVFFCVVLVLLWHLFVINLLQWGVFPRLVVELYFCEGDSDKPNGFDQSKISDYGHQYIEELVS